MTLSVSAAQALARRVVERLLDDSRGRRSPGISLDSVPSVLEWERAGAIDSSTLWPPPAAA
jgi:hypothetical protein